MLKNLFVLGILLPFLLIGCPDCGGICGDSDTINSFDNFNKIQKQANDSRSSYQNWRKAKTAYTKCDYETGVAYMNKALNNETHNENAFFKLERAKMQQMLGDLNLSLQDLNDVIEQREKQNLYDDYYVKALYGAVSIYAHSDLKIAAKLYEKIRKHDKDVPKVDILEEDGLSMIYSNLSSAYEDKVVRQLLLKNFIQFGLANSEDDVDFTDNNTIIIKLPKCMEEVATQKKLNSEQRISETSSNNQIDFCKENCSTVASGAMIACGYLPTNKCRLACMGTVEGLRRACSWCCDSGSFYSKCIKPLENFFPPPCDPAWD